VTVTTGVNLLQVSWQSVDTANIEPVIDYTATAYNSSGSAVNSCTTAATSCSISSLIAGTTYQVSITARNTLGSSSPSAQVSGMAGYPPNWTPSDPYYVNGSLWGLNGRYGVSAPGAWTRNRGAASVVVAVIDTGSTSHPDLNANTVAGYDFISDPSNAADGNGWDADANDPGDASGGYRSSWHGTHVAGTIGAVSDSSGVVGVAPSTTMQHIRVLGTRGGSVADIASGIIWASGGAVPGAPTNRTPAKVINMSLGGPSYSCSSTFQNAINTAVSRGTTVVVAAGNDDEDARYFSPANCNNVITVAAISSSGNRASFSNYGSVVDIAAPGVNIYSTLNSGSSSPASPTWASYQGTSMAAPHVAGVVALMLANNPSLTPQTIEANIKNSSNVTPFAGNRCDSYWNFVTCGTGVINASSLLGSTFNPAVAPASPVLVPTNPGAAAVTTVSVNRNQRISSKTFAARAAIRVPAKHKVKLSVVGSKKVCKISRGKVVALKPGACRVKVTVSGKVKVGKKMKMKKTTKIITMAVS
jgi:subtilisin family serine protease